MAKTNFALMGFTISITWIMFIASLFFIRSISILWDSWFSGNALVIAIVSGIVILIGIITGMITISSLTKKFSI